MLKLCKRRFVQHHHQMSVGDNFTLTSWTFTNINTNLDANVPTNR